MVTVTVSASYIPEPLNASLQKQPTAIPILKQILSLEQASLLVLKIVSLAKHQRATLTA
jgi:hypothetical protein